MANLFVDPIVPVFFVYGLAFYTMGLAVVLKSGGWIADRAVRRAMRLLAVFALIHGTHEWFEMFFRIGTAASGFVAPPALEMARTAVLMGSFAFLAAFGVETIYLHAPRALHRWTLGVLLAISATGVLAIILHYLPDWDTITRAADAWARYSLGAVGATIAGVGLLVQARDNRRAELYAVSRGWLVTGVALIVYGLVGQTASAPSVLFPSTVYNTQTFQHLFGFPIQLLRAAVAVTSTVGVLGALRALELERRRAERQATDARFAAQAEAQQALAQRETLQKELLRRTVGTQEDERARIARELHDGIGQTLTALVYRVTALEALPDNGKPVTPEMVENVHQLATQAHADLRQLVTDLRPAQLDDLGLVAALHWLADQTRRQLDLDVSVVVDGRKKRLPGEIETTLFRIAQEALTNVVKYAEVDEACIRLSFEPKFVILEIIDHGVGFDVKAALDVEVTEREAWGLIGMQERATLAGGRLLLLSTPEKGSVVRVIIPMPGEHTHDGLEHDTHSAG